MMALEGYGDTNNKDFALKIFNDRDTIPANNIIEIAYNEDNLKRGESPDFYRFKNLPRDTYLMNRKDQQKVFEKEGQIKKEPSENGENYGS